MIEPIEWKPYQGEKVCVNTIIRGGKKIQEWQFYEDRVKAVPRGNAYCIGNGPSRKGFDLSRLRDTGQLYGCNALYRDILPDFIFFVTPLFVVIEPEPSIGMNLKPPFEVASRM